MSSKNTMVFEGECRNCPHTIRKALPPNGHLLSGERLARIRCKECRTTNALTQTDVQ